MIENGHRRDPRTVAQVRSLYGQGHPVKHIAHLMNCSLKTVYNYLKNSTPFDVAPLAVITSRVIPDAEMQAKAIIADAEDKAKRIIADAMTEADRIRARIHRTYELEKPSKQRPPSTIEPPSRARLMGRR